MLRSLRSRLIATFVLPALTLFGVAGTAGFIFSRRILEDELGRSLSAIAASTAVQLNAERVLSIEPGDDVVQTRTFRNLSRALTEIRDASGARRLYVVDTEGRLRIDSDGSLPVGAPVPELARDRLELSFVFQGRRFASQVLFEGRDGRLYKTGYAPLKQGDRVVGAVAVEGGAAFFGPLARLFRGYALLVAASLLLLAAVAALMARTVARPLQRLMTAALRIGSGDLSTAVPPERTREIGVLAQELEAMRRALESRDRQLKMMLAGVAHEVRNPIGGIELFAGLLAEDLSAEHADVVEARGRVDRIRREIDYLKRIVEDFLSFAREQKLARAPLRARSVVETVAEVMKPEITRHLLTLRVEAADAEIDGDESLLCAALTNLVKNAAQASVSGGEIVILGRVEGDSYAFEVTDHGRGIDAALEEKIFEPFFTTREKGTGLGLPLARKIARAHGGDLSVRGTPGLTTFVFRISSRPSSTLLPL